MLTLVLSALATPGEAKKPVQQPEPVRVTMGLLDGRTYTIELVDPATGDKEIEGPGFIYGKLYAPGRDFWGFTSAPYTATAEGDGIRFTSTGTSATNGTIVWNGVVKGDRIEGTMTWTRPGQAMTVWPFTGTRFVVGE